MKLYYSPLSTYSMKTLIGLYEKEVEFEKCPVDLSNPKEKREYREKYPIGRLPLLELEDGYIIPESSIILEWLDQNYPFNALIPEGAEISRRTRFYDRMNDLYLNDSICNIFFQGLKPEAEQNKKLIEKSKYYLETCFRALNKELDDNEYLVGNEFTMADCSAFPALFYCQKFYPYDHYQNLVEYGRKLMDRPSVKLVLDEVFPALEKWENDRRK